MVKDENDRLKEELSTMRIKNQYLQSQLIMRPNSQYYGFHHGPDTMAQ